MALIYFYSLYFNGIGLIFLIMIYFFNNNNNLTFLETKFKQQNLPAWQPILTASTVLPAFFAIGLAFIPLGVALLITSNNVSSLQKIILLMSGNINNGNAVC